MNFLTDKERQQLKAQHRVERDGRIRDRIKAVLLYDKGWAIQAIAEALLLSDDAIRNHVFEYQESKKLKPENGGSTPKLSWEQSQKFIEHLRGHIYLYVKEIIAYVQSTMNIIYTVPGMRDWLRRSKLSDHRQLTTLQQKSFEKNLKQQRIKKLKVIAENLLGSAPAIEFDHLTPHMGYELALFHSNLTPMPLKIERKVRLIQKVYRNYLALKRTLS